VSDEARNCDDGSRVYRNDSIHAENIFVIFKRSFPDAALAEQAIPSRIVAIPQATTLARSVLIIKRVLCPEQNVRKSIGRADTHEMSFRYTQHAIRAPAALHVPTQVP
jgi:hypothetical protein